jgi:hypothetical protein
VNVAVTPASATTTTTTTSGVKAVLKSGDYHHEREHLYSESFVSSRCQRTRRFDHFHSEELFGNSRIHVAPSNTEAPAFSSSLLSSAYSKGYLETKDATKDNVITLRIISSDLRYNNTSVQNLYRSAMDNYLKSQKIYAAIEFDDTADINSDLNAFMAKGNDSSLTNQIYEIYDKLMSETHITDYASYQSGATSYAHAEATSFATYAELLAADSAEFRTKLNGYLTTIVTGAFSDTGLQYVLNATDLIYKAYKGKSASPPP